jgi:hypothetical protein
MPQKSTVIGVLLIIALLNTASELRCQSENERPTDNNKTQTGMLQEVATLNIGTAIDVATDGNTLCVVGRFTLTTADISDPRDPKILGQLALTGGRQIVIANHIAYITARDPGKGVFVIDVSNPRTPRLLCHYDADVSANTTGIAISGNILSIAGTSHGMELVDVTNPRSPEHLSTLYVGEVQSVAFRHGIVYAPIHRAKELIVVDAHNPRAPAIIGRAPLDGYSDGVQVAGRYCYVATGHHDRSTTGLVQTEVKPDHPGWGRGHGLEIFDISSPDKPVLVGRVKFPPFCIVGPDWWGVEVAGHYAYIADGINGAIVVDVADPAKPRVVASKQFFRQQPWGKSRWPHQPDRKEAFAGDLPSLATNLIDYTSSIAVINDFIFVANLCGYEKGPEVKGGINVLAAPGIANLPEPWDLTPVQAGSVKKSTDPRVIYQPGSSIHAVDFKGDTALVAAGSGGLQTMRIWPEVRVLKQYKSRDIVMDVKVSGNLVFAAEGLAGLSIWRFAQDGSLTLLGRYHPKEGIPVQSVSIPPPGKFALLDANGIEIVDVSDPANPVFRLHDLGNYGFGMAEDILNKRYALAYAAHTPINRYDLYGGPVPRKDGIECAASMWGNNVIVLENDKLLVGSGIRYRLFDRGEKRKLNELPLYSDPSVKGVEVGSGGRLSHIGSRLFFSDNRNNRVHMLDISEAEKPRFVDTLEVEGKPSRVAVHGGHIFVPAGYGSLYCVPLPEKREHRN